jgi:hypothetical protein
MTETASPPASIDQLLAHWGVMIEHRENATEIHVPPVPSWADLPKGYRFIRPLFIFAGIFAFMAICSWRNGDHGAVPGFAADAGIGCVAGLWVLALGSERLRRYLVIEVREDRLSLFRLTPQGKVPFVEGMFCDVHGAHINRSNGKLSVPIPHDDPIEVYLTPNAEVNRWIAAQVANGVQSVKPPATQSDGLAYATPFAAGELKSWKSVLRQPMIFIAVILVIVSIAMLFTPIPPLGCGTLFLATIVAGIAIGTQKKDLFF